jgi:hypothetical protein
VRFIQCLVCNLPRLKPTPIRQYLNYNTRTTYWDLRKSPKQYMARPPPQQCGNSTPERPYIDSGPRTQHRGPTPMPYPYPHEPRQIIPQSTSYGRPMHGAPLGPRLPALVVPERSTDPRYMLSSDNAYMNTQSTPQTLPLRPYHQYPGSSDARGYYNPYDERTYPTSGHARDYESHRSWTYDVESQ